MNRFVSWVFSLLLFLFFLVAFIVSFTLSRNSPVIFSIEPSEAFPGDIIQISGSGFGIEKNRNRVFLDKTSLTSSHIINWSDSLISIKLPSFGNSALVYVETRSGKSGGNLLINTGYFPSISDEPYISGYPYIYMEDPEIYPGKLVTISGTNLLSRKGGSRIIIKQNISPQSLMEKPDREGSITINEDDIFFWDNERIRFIYTGYPVSGFLYVINATGHSNPVYLDVISDSAEILLTQGNTYHLSNGVDIDRVASLPGNYLNIRLSAPQHDMRQNPVHLLKRNEYFIRSDKSVNLYTLNDLMPGKAYSLKQDYLLSSSSLEIVVENYPKQSIDTNWPAYQLYTEAEDLLPVDNAVIRRLARNLTSSRSSVLKNAEAIYFFVMKHLEYSYKGESDVLNLLNPTDADETGYVFFMTSILRAAGIPARPVFGIEIDGNEAAECSWVEFFVPEIGWFPADPSGHEQGKENTWGSLPANRISYSHGLEKCDTFDNISDSISTPDYAWQKCREEFNDNLEFMRTIWHDVSVVGTYR